MRKLFWIPLALAIALPAAAQNVSIGAQLGAGESLTNGLDYKLKNVVREVYVGAEFEPGSTLILRGGQTKLDSENANVPVEKKLDYLDAVVQYDMDQVFGSAGIFAGLGYYRQRFSDVNETSYGFTAGVNGTFPVTRRMAVVGEVGYHSIHFEERESFVTATGGLKISF